MYATYVQVTNIATYILYTIKTVLQFFTPDTWLLLLLLLYVCMYVYKYS